MLNSCAIRNLGYVCSQATLDIPLSQGSDPRLKIYKISASIALRLFSNSLRTVKSSYTLRCYKKASESPVSEKPGARLSNKSWAEEFFLGTLKVGIVQLLSHVRLFATSWTVAHQALCPWGFSRQEYLNSLPFPSPRDLPRSWVKLVSPALAGRFFTTNPPGKPIKFILYESIQLPRNLTIQRITRS